MATQFLSRVERGTKPNPYVDVGPGAYESGSAISSGMPGFAPFSTSARRMTPMRESHSPPPGHYNTSEDLTKKKGVTSGFKSHTQRFTDRANVDDPGPGSYIPKSTLVHPVPVFNRPNRSGVLPMRPASPPSIPAKSQSHGYEVTASGAVRPQPPAIPGYSGRGSDTVGPADYNPTIDFKFHGPSRAVFPRDPARTELDKTLAKRSDAPGPGHYNMQSTFDLSGGDHNPMESDFLVHLNAAKKRQLSVFESKTSRSAFDKEIAARKAMPGPGQYSLPASIKVGSKPSSLQFFASCEPRFKEELPRSMRLQTAPGSYNVITSDFDQQRLQIMRRKKIVQRSTWAQGVGFASTTGRFVESDQTNDVPPATTYTPKVSLMDELAKSNVRAGAFGSKSSRFKDPTERPTLTNEQLKERALNQDIANYLAKHPKDPQEGAAGSSRRPQFSSVFAPQSDSRLRPVKTPPGPAPGAYDLSHDWAKTKGVLPMVPKSTMSMKIHDTMPGPGQYNTVSPLGPRTKNRKNVMISTTTRSLQLGHTDTPGPGNYDPSPVSGSMIRPSFNILLSDKY